MMMYTTAILSAAHKELCCAICVDMLTNPVLLPACGHCFCSTCAHRTMERSSQCPLCKTPIGSSRALLPLPLLNEVVMLASRLAQSQGVEDLAFASQWSQPTPVAGNSPAMGPMMCGGSGGAVGGPLSPMPIVRTVVHQNIACSHPTFSDHPTQATVEVPHVGSAGSISPWRLSRCSTAKDNNNNDAPLSHASDSEFERDGRSRSSAALHRSDRKRQRSITFVDTDDSPAPLCVAPAAGVAARSMSSDSAPAGASTQATQALFPSDDTDATCMDAVTLATTSGIRRGRGRPRKNDSPLLALGPSSVPVAGGAPMSTTTLSMTPVVSPQQDWSKSTATRATTSAVLGAAKRVAENICKDAHHGLAEFATPSSSLSSLSGANSSDDDEPRWRREHQGGIFKSGRGDPSSAQCGGRVSQRAYPDNESDWGTSSSTTLSSSSSDSEEKLREIHRGPSNGADPKQQTAPPLLHQYVAASHNPEPPPPPQSAARHDREYEVSLLSSHSDPPLSSVHSCALCHISIADRKSVGSLLGNIIATDASCDEVKLRSVNETMLEGLLGALCGPFRAPISSSSVAPAASTKKRLGSNQLYVHYNCLLWSPEVSRDATDGSLQQIPNVLRRGLKIKCAFCKQLGATLGCADPACRKSFHVPCAMLCGPNVCTIDEPTFTLRCAVHAAFPLPAIDDPKCPAPRKTFPRPSAPAKR
ncbi:zinc finger protein, putative [Bodo saltans]|uniref:Zinc finger protein, putative n=1 Tax=Bodo saltans TaxID=75058 RepID=A0A0S4IMY1_BODSA|nr:zinc finger protein, putative [Bodo saltans]|eukprot:CUF55897.1 zinc finger protein, putative [Bodo saltans]